MFPISVALLSFHVQPPTTVLRFAASSSVSPPAIQLMAGRKPYTAPVPEYENETDMQYRKRMAQDKTYTAPAVKASAASAPKVALSPSEVKKAAAAPADGSSFNLVGAGAFAAAVLTVGLKIKQATEYVPPPAPSGPPILPIALVGIAVALIAATGGPEGLLVGLLKAGNAVGDVAEKASTSAPAEAAGVVTPSGAATTSADEQELAMPAPEPMSLDGIVVPETVADK